VRGESGDVIRSASQVNTGDLVAIQVADGGFSAHVEGQAIRAHVDGSLAAHQGFQVGPHGFGNPIGKEDKSVARFKV